MKRLRIGLLFAVCFLSACNHQDRANQTQAEAGSAPVGQTSVARNDSELTGEPQSATASSVPPSYPRATPVALPPASLPPAASPAPAAPVASATASSSETAPPNLASSAPASMPANSPDSNPPAEAVPVPAPSSETNSGTPGLAMNPPTPLVATNPPTAWDDDDPQKQVVVLETSLGRIVIELDDIYAPRTCGNFRKLVSNGFYNHTTFHRVIPNFMIQGGDPNSKSEDRATYGQGDPGYTLPAEIKLKHVAGAVAMARLPDSANPQRESNGSQFFICVAPCPSLDDQYTVFGHVIKGMDIAVQIANQRRDPRDDPVTRIEMEARLEPKKQALEESPASP